MVFLSSLGMRIIVLANVLLVRLLPSASSLCLFTVGGCGPSGGSVGRADWVLHEWTTPCLMTARMRGGRGAELS